MDTAGAKSAVSAIIPPSGASFPRSCPAGPRMAGPRSRIRRIMRLIDSFEMLGRPGMSWPAALAAFRRRFE